VASAVTLTAPRVSPRFLAGVAAAPALLGVAHLLPETGVGLSLRLAAATVVVLLLPGALILRAIGWPTSPGVAAAGAVSLSLGVVFVALLVTFAGEANLTLTTAVVAIFAGAAVWPAALACPPASDRSERLAVLGVLAVGVVLAAIVWWAAGTISGDALFHLARVRKLDDFEILYSVRAANEFIDGGLHPGYAFPLWHGVLALVARIGGVDPAEVVRHLATVLTPLALLVSYGAGRALFRSWAGGVAALTVTLAQLGFSRAGTGSFAFLALPATSARVLIVPAVLALVFALAGGGSWSLLAPLVAAGTALALVHPTYALFLALPLAGLVVARIALEPGDRGGPLRLALALPTLLVPFFLYSLWILPVLNSTVARGEDDRARALGRYAGQLDVVGGAYRLAPDFIARGGAAVVAALLAVPVAALAARRLWGALVLGGSLAVFLVVLVPPVFTPFADAVSISQGRRLAAFLPLVFALAGAAVLLGRLRLVGVVVALAAGALLQALYPGEFSYRVGEGGPGWTVWLALVGGALALALAVWRRPAGPEPTLWAALAAVAFALPMAVTGLADVRKEDRPDRYALTPGLVAELQTIEKRRVILSNLEASYRVAAYAPLYIVGAPPAHVARTKLNRPLHRRRDVVAFFFRRGVSDVRRREILDDYLVHAVLVDKSRRYPREFVRYLYRIYEDERYVLYRVHPT
jgi:hypothetical protein